MIRQLIIGSLFGIALGGVATASIAHGVFAGVGEDSTATESTDSAHHEAASIRAGSRMQPPLRPGSARVTPPPAATAAPDLPVALDAHPTDKPTV